MMKKIAIPTREGIVDDHFGHCAYYTRVTPDEQNDCNNHEEKPVRIIPSFKKVK